MFMMGKTHIFIGIASALVLTAPDNLSDCLPAIVGGAVGGSISDIDVSSSKNGLDSLYAKLMATGIIPIALVIDYIIDGGIIDYVKNCNNTDLLIGVVLFMILCFIGSKQEHRGFTHSLLALFLFGFSIGFFCMPILIPFVIGFISHILLDILNKKPVKLFFPSKKGVCLKLCYSNKTVDKALLTIGIFTTLAFLGYLFSKNININLII